MLATLKCLGCAATWSGRAGPWDCPVCGSRYVEWTNYEQDFVRSRTAGESSGIRLSDTSSSGGGGDASPIAQLGGFREGPRGGRGLARHLQSVWHGSRGNAGEHEPPVR